MLCSASSFTHPGAAQFGPSDCHLLCTITTRSARGWNARHVNHSKDPTHLYSRTQQAAARLAQPLLQLLSHEVTTGYDGLSQSRAVPVLLYDFALDPTDPSSSTSPAV